MVFSESASSQYSLALCSYRPDAGRTGRCDRPIPRLGRSGMQTPVCLTARLGCAERHSPAMRTFHLDSPTPAVVLVAGGDT
jgi:hypothetical protein